MEVIDGLDLGGMIGVYRGSGSAAHHPRMRLGVLVYGYATGVFSRRKLERATHDSVAFRYIAAYEPRAGADLTSDWQFAKIERRKHQSDRLCHVRAFYLSTPLRTQGPH